MGPAPTRCLTSIALLLSLGVAALADDTRARVDADLAHLTGLGSRVVGYPGHDAAADYIEDRFRQLGLLDVRRDAFDVVVPVDRGATLTPVESGETIPLRGVWPNQVRTPTVPQEGLRAPLLYAGDGTLVHVRGRPLAGRVALMEFNSQLNWLQLAALGVRAVIFIGPEETTQHEAVRKYALTPVSVPRFWIDRAAGAALRRRLQEGEETDVVLRGRMDWMSRPAWNIVATVPTEAGVDTGAGTVYLHSHYDGTSVVPSLDPGMQSAASIVGLLETARHLVADPPRRRVRVLALSAHYQAHQGMLAALVQQPLPDLFLGLDLSTGSDQLGLWNNTPRFELKRLYLPYSRSMMAHGTAAAEMLGRDPETALVNGITPLRGLDWASYASTAIPADGILALAAKTPALTLATVHDGRQLLFTPLDTLTATGVDNLTRQIRMLREVVRRSLQDSSLLDGSQALTRALKRELTTLRVQVRTFPRRSQGPDRPVPDALVLLQRFDKQKGGVIGQRVHLTARDGHTTIDPLPHGGWSIAAYVLDPSSGEIVYAPDLSLRSEAHHGKPLLGGYLGLSARLKSQEKAIVLFPTIARDLHSLIAPRSLQALSAPRMLDATGALAREYGYALSLYEEEPAAVIFGPRGDGLRDRVKFVLPGTGGGILLTNATGHLTEEEARGRGFLLSDVPIGETALQAARDLWNLDEYRLRQLRRHGIGSQWLERLHGRVFELLDQAEVARADLAWDRYVSLTREALGLEARAYPEVLGTLNDVIGGMVFILALLLPAAFFAERLFIAAVDIRRQIAAFGLILLVVWVLLSQVHPAFALAHPVVVILGFTIMAIAVFVLSMISARFSRARQEYRDSVSQIHVADISRFGAAFTAFMLGISNMQRRRLRTALTLVTLTLLTFTVMSFTSFQRQMQFLKLAVDAEGSRTGLLIRDLLFSRLDITALDYARSHFSPFGAVGARYWYEDPGETYEIEVRGGGTTTFALGLVGLDPLEATITPIDATLLHGSFFAENDETSCLLSATMAAELGIGVREIGSAAIHVRGRDLTVRGIFDAGRLEQLIDLDGGTMMPIDERLTPDLRGPTAQVDEEILVDEVMLSRNVVRLAADRVLLLPDQTTWQVGGVLKSIAVGFDAEVDEIGLVEGYLTRVAATIWATVPTGAQRQSEIVRYSSVGLTAIRGVAQLFIPALIASLIVLNTMLGAVYERTREIGVYSSVGLSPLHIAFLFLAEACVHGVLGVTFGYLVGLGMGKILLLAGALHGVSLNYSSTAAMVSSGGVIAVVLLSTLYPARVAARIAVPEATPRWRPPPPDDDHWDLEFPFNVSDSEALGTCGFLYSYFESHAGAVSGRAYTEDLAISRWQGETGAPNYALAFRMWLSPYDLGVSEDVRIELKPTVGAATMYAIDVRITRHSGEQLHWQRLNRPFFQRLRKQLLIWNALTPQARQNHRRTGERQLELTLTAASAATRVGGAEAVGERQPVDASAGRTTTADEPTPRSPFSLKGLAVGTAMSLVVSVAATYGVFIIRGSRMALNSTAPIAIFYFFLVVAVANLAVILSRRRLGLPKADLVLIYVMMTLAATVPNQSFVGVLIPTVAGYFYYATDANNWADLYGDHLPGWLMPDREAAVLLHEGLPPGTGIPWEGWTVCLGSWYLFFMALALLMVCLNVVMHRQWSVHERLEYPMVQLPLALTEQDEGTLAGMAPLVRNRRMWLGLLIPVVFLGMRGLHHYLPGIPVFSFSWGYLSPIDGMSLRLHAVLAWIGISYLVSKDISFSIWVFFILGQLQDAMFRKFGVAPTEQLSFYSIGATADIAHQSMGACLVFVLGGLWMARRHLVQVWRCFLGRGASYDAEELIPYRWAVLGGLGSLLVLAAWLWASGIPPLILPAFLATCLVFYILVTRVVSTAGVATARTPMIAAFVVISGLGSSLIGVKGLVALTFTYIWQGEMRLLPMIMTANGLKLAESVRGPKKRLFWAMLLAVAVGIAGSTWVTMDLAHTHGGINLDNFMMKHQATRIYNDMARHLREPIGADWRGWGFTGLGATIEAALIGAQYRFAWWPLHPIGFIIANGWLTGHLWFSVFLGWGIKSLIMRYGGMQTYLGMKPFFLGLILGEAVIGGVWTILDFVLGGTGNNVTWM